LAWLAAFRSGDDEAMLACVKSMQVAKRAALAATTPIKTSVAIAAPALAPTSPTVTSAAGFIISL
jgi:hypothetical protein